MKKILISVNETTEKELDDLAIKMNEYIGIKPNRSRALRKAIHEYWKILQPTKEK